MTSVDSLTSRETDEGLANEALRATNFRLWLVLDRLDVAFIQNDDLEQNALRACLGVSGYEVA